MRIHSYLSLLIICAVFSQGITLVTHENIDYSSELHIRKKRLLDQSPNGGRSVQLTMAPYIVNILRNGVRHCSGTILHPDIILSVISCTWTPFPVSVSILSNSPMRNEGTHHNITNQVFGTVNYLVLLKIHPPIDLELSNNRKIELFHGNLPPNVYGIFSGWGSIGLDRRLLYPEQLMQTRLPIIPPQECLHGHFGDFLITFRHMCTLDRSRRRATSIGDEGGALVHQRRLLGVLLHRSREVGVYPDVFVKLDLPEHQNWVTSRITRLRKNLVGYLQSSDCIK